MNEKKIQLSNDNSIRSFMEANDKSSRNLLNVQLYMYIHALNICKGILIY